MTIVFQNFNNRFFVERLLDILLYVRMFDKSKFSYLSLIQIKTLKYLK